MGSRGQRIRELFGGQHHADRHAAGEPLGERDGIGTRAGSGRAQKAPEAPDAGLNLVQEQERAGRVARLAKCFQEARRRRQDAAFALNRLDDHGANVRLHLLLHRVDVAVVDVRHVAELSEALAILRRSGHRERAQRAPVKAVVERDDAGARRFTLGVEVPARQLQKRFVRLRAGVAEERAVHLGAPAKLVGEQDVRRVVEVVRRVDDLRGLIADGFDVRRMRVADGVDRDAGAEVEVLLSGGVFDVAAFAAHEDERCRLVVAVQAALGEREEIRLAGRVVGHRAFGSTLCSRRQR